MPEENKQDSRGGIDGPFRTARDEGSTSPKASPFRFLPASSFIPESQITATLLVPFTPDGRILAVQHATRGIDIPGGHRENTDVSNFETARRELLEESGAHIGQITPCLIMETKNYKRKGGSGDGASEPSYMVVMTGVVRDLGHFTPTKEIVGRHLLSPQAFLEAYGGEYEADMAFILQAAQQTIDNDRGIAPDFSSAS